VELIIFVTTLCIVGVLAARIGHDSRMPPDSKEQDLANFGLSWEGNSTTVGSTWREAAMFRLGHFAKRVRSRIAIPETLLRTLRERAR
jgi:hypothetical protein